ncbi:MAG: class I mannose-6-phosphate isomerase [Chloroflexi bacterium]|nr:class I mannose-6-phosphate isomerase [Chloroflexota bacterium]
MSDEMEIYPYSLEGVPQEKMWGGRNLERLLHKSLPAGRLIGEAWEAWPGCVVMNGPQAGQRLSQLLERNPRAVLGDSAPPDALFPLLFKYVDAQDDLSVQVHPDDLGARQQEGLPLGKTEAWYILHAEPGAVVIHGFKADLDAATVHAHLRERRLADLLSVVRVQAGDVLFVPAGVVHAIGKGIVLAEIQQNCDITYRLYDWDRKLPSGQGRDLHVDKAMPVLDLTGLSEHYIPPLTIHHDGYDQQALVACRYFVLERLTIHAPQRAFRLNGKFHILSCIEGAATISGVPVAQGRTVLVPAGLETYDLSPTAVPCRLLRAYVPSLREDVIAPLVAAGHDAAGIARLGGFVSRYNDLLPWVNG